MASFKYTTGAYLQCVTLDSAYTAGSGSMVLTSGHGARLPASGDFWLATQRTTLTAAAHIWKGTARSGDTVTVTCETDYSADTNLDAGTALGAIFDSKALDQLRQDICQSGAYASLPTGEKAGQLYIPTDSCYDVLRYNGSAWEHFRFGRELTPPDSSDFTAVGSPTASIVTTYGGIHVTGSNNTDAEYMRTASLSTPWRIELGLSAVLTNANYAGVGILLRAGASGAIIKMVVQAASGSLSFKTQKYDSSNTYVGEGVTLGQIAGAYDPRNMIMGVRDDGTTRYYETSIDGIYWTPLGSESRTTHATVDRGGFFSYNTSGSYPPNTRFWHYKETAL